MKYITLNELSKTIRENLWKIPRDIDFIITIPRSGTIAGAIISEFLNVPMVEIDAFINGAKPTGGGRLRYYDNIHKENTNKVLVVDDTVYNGTSKYAAKEKLKNFTDYTFIFMAVYQEGPNRNAVDFFLEDVSIFTNNFTQLVLYEWNIFHHNEDVMEGCLYDMDGVLCLNPPDERNEEEYLKFIRNAPPLFIPSVKIGGIATYRLSKNRKITEEWLSEHNVKYDALFTFKANSWEERNANGISPAEYKSLIYSSSEKFKLFVESDSQQAEIIHKITKKPVLCIENNVLYD